MIVSEFCASSIHISDSLVVLGYFENHQTMDHQCPTPITLPKDALQGLKFTGKRRTSCHVRCQIENTWRTVVCVGLGAQESSWSSQDLEELGAFILDALPQNESAQDVSVWMPTLTFKDSHLKHEAQAWMASGALLKSWQFHRYKTVRTSELKKNDYRMSWMSDHPEACETSFKTLKAIAEGVFLTRDCVSEPPNVLSPQGFAERIVSELEPLGIQVTLMKKTDLEKEGMNALLGVAQGSTAEPYVAVMHWKGCQDQCQEPVALVGKGVTFDSGGISLKPSKDMDHMKYDMAGAGAVVGAMKALAGRKSSAHVVGIVGLVENMPDGHAQRPGDIVKSLSGQTIEILNTDAEGRLVLCDLLTYVQKTYHPRVIADLATLTGAIVIALGEEHAGIFTDHDDVATQLSESGAQTGERVWRLPLCKAYDRLLDSPVADIKNISGGGPGSITAAQFLKRFVKEGKPWVHIDIAGMAWSHKGDRRLSAKGATAYGVRLIDRWIRTYYEH